MLFDVLDRLRTEPARMRRGPWLAVMAIGDVAVREADAIGASSPSCHCRCRMTDLVAHCLRF